MAERTFHINLTRDSMTISRISDGATLEVTARGFEVAPFGQANSDTHWLEERMKMPGRLGDREKQLSASNEISGVAHASKTAAVELVRDFVKAAAASEKAGDAYTFTAG